MRDIRLIFGFHCFHIKQYQVDQRDALIDLATEYSVNKIHQTLEHIRLKVKEQPENEIQLAALELIEKTIPVTIASEVKRGWKSNSEAKRSKFLKKPIITLDTIIEFNGYMQASIHQYEMAEHIYDTNMMEAYYYQTAMDCINQGRNMPPLKFEKFRTKELFFRMFPRFELPYYRYLHFPKSLLIVIIFATLSGVVILAELHLFFKYKAVSTFITDTIFYQGQTQVYMLYLIVGTFFGYMIFISIYSIFSMKIWGFYGFYVRKTDPVTFLSFAYYMAKLTYPLCYTVLYATLGESSLLRMTSFYMVVSCYSRVLET